ncbi:hypothetical protein DFH94DRAFT_769535 [Russula ochroleuca]|uniref:Secreted protein n=1 Tax=Russula ochroleuca TaxID=152965 RepID=A0A9P5JZV1_9AGAM|nr:hypothetical protein DFH94DRAFT_769535 [Russula ochroleuca]
MIVLRIANFKIRIWAAATARLVSAVQSSASSRGAPVKAGFHKLRSVVGIVRALLRKGCGEAPLQRAPSRTGKFCR